MKFYADMPGRRLRQIVTDLCFAAWLVVWIRVGMAVRDSALLLAKPGEQTAESATVLQRNLTDAGDRLSSVPLVGDGMSTPFDSMAGAAEKIADAGRAQVHAVELLANWLGVSIALIPCLIVALVYVPLRLRFVRRATAGQRFIDSGADLDLFALRALANQPMHVLGRISDDPAGAWRDRDSTIIAELARVELKNVGLRPPTKTQ